MFQSQDRLFSKIVLNVLFAISVIVIPTVILLCIIGGRTIQSEEGALIVDLSLGVILVFSSLAAVIAPFVYRPANVLSAMFLAKSWIAASAQTSHKSSNYLPSTPQYLLAVGNMGTPGLMSLWKSTRYYFRRKSNLSPVFTHSTFVLAALVFTASMITIGDIWIHVSSTAVLQQSVLTTDNLHSFSRGFAPSENETTAPWRLQQGLQTFLGVNTVSTVTKFDDTMVIIPVDIPADRAVVGSTIGLQLTCRIINLDCIFDQTENPETFDCSNVIPGAQGPITSNINVTLYPSDNSTSIRLLASMALPTLFNQSFTILPTQIFQCGGSMENITYSSVNSDFNIIESNNIDFSSLTTLLNLDEFAGKRDVIENSLTTVGTSTIFVQGSNITSMPQVFADGLSRLLLSFISGQTIPTQSLRESPSSNKILSRVPLAPIIFLAVSIAIAILAISVVGLRALLAVTNPPTLDGNPISIINLHRQLISPIEILANTIGDTPLAMKIQFSGQVEPQVQLDGLPNQSDTDLESLRKRRATSQSDLNLPLDDVEGGFRDDMTLEEDRIFLGRERRTSGESEGSEARSVSSDLRSTRYSTWEDGEFHPVHIDYDRT